MRNWPLDSPGSGYVSFAEFQRNMRSLMGEMNQLDRNNLGNEQVTGAKIAVGALGDVVKAYRSAPYLVTLDLTQLRGSEYRIPDDSGDDWYHEFSSQEGFLSGSLGGTILVEASAGGDWPTLMWVGVRLNGTLVGKSPISQPQWAGYTGVHLDFATPIRSGTSRLDFIFGRADDTDYSAKLDITFEDFTFFGTTGVR